MAGKKKLEKNTQPCSNKCGWHYAILVASEKIKRLQLSIKTFEEMCASGEPFPGESAEQAESEAT